jgi:asparagine synthase (glutamine-hydrolysing)
MCGLGGVYQFQGHPLDQSIKPIIDAMSLRLRFRGPDEERQYHDPGRLSLFFRRLAVVDLQSGSQPFVSANNDVVVIVNGEIYNHLQLRRELTPDYPYQSQSDSEVVLALYLTQGLDFLNHLNGMFAIAIYDKRQHHLILIRDRLGIKPLFYCQTDDNHLLFASEVKSIYAHPRCPRQFNWLACLARRFNQRNIFTSLPESIYTGIQQLDPGNYVIFSDKGIQQHSWWGVNELERQGPNELQSRQAYIDEYGALLEDSVKLRLMTDVDMGVCLSGGIDSVAIAALANPHKVLPSFTVLCNSTYLNGDVQAAHQAAELLGIDNHQLYFPWRQNEIQLVDVKRILYDLEMPLTMEQIYKYLLYHKIKADFPNLKTLLMGQGSDEFNGGYSVKFAEDIPLSHANETRTWTHFIESLAKMKHHFIINHTNPALNDYMSLIKTEFIEQSFNLEHYSPWQWYQKMYQRSVVDFNLWHEDRATAANQMENRVPFLDHRLVEFCYRVPDKMQPSLFWDKAILREYMATKIPKELAHRAKVPFFLGEGERYTARLAYQILTDNDCDFINEALFENKYVEDVLNSNYLKQQLSAVSQCPSFEGALNLFEYACWGQLAKWVAEGMPEQIAPLQAKFDWYSLKDYETQSTNLAGILSESDIQPTDVFAFKANMAPMIPYHHSNDLFIANHLNLEYIIEAHEKPEFIHFLKHIDGHNRLSDIAQAGGYLYTKIISDIADALECQVIEKLSKSNG